MDEKDIGSNIRAIREQAGLTVTAAAELAQLTKSTLSKIEKGQVSPPISTLLRVAKALDAELASFFTQPGERPTVAFTRHNQGRIITRDGSRFGYAYQALALDMQGKHAEPFVLTIQPGDPPGHFQHQGQEFIYMLAGGMTFEVGEQSFTMRKGDSLYFNANVPHMTSVIGKQPARFVCLFIDDSPALATQSTSRRQLNVPSSTNKSITPIRRTRPGRPASQYGDKRK